MKISAVILLAACAMIGTAYALPAREMNYAKYLAKIQLLQSLLQDVKEQDPAYEYPRPDQEEDEYAKYKAELQFFNTFLQAEKEEQDYDYPAPANDEKPAKDQWWWGGGRQHTHHCNCNGPQNGLLRAQDDKKPAKNQWWGGTTHHHCNCYSHNVGGNGGNGGSIDTGNCSGGKCGNGNAGGGNGGNVIG